MSLPKRRDLKLCLCLLGKGLLLSLLSCCISISSYAFKEKPCSKGRRACFDRKIQKHKAKQTKYYESFLKGPLKERVFLATQEVIDYINLDNQKNNYPHVARTPVLDQDFLKDLKQAIQEIPGAVKKKLEGKLVGIALVTNLGGTGFTDALYGDKKKVSQGLIILDQNVLSQRVANSWATWKENTPFRDNKDYKIEMIIEPPESNNRVGAIRYILLHEIGHILSIGENIHPSWWKQDNSTSKGIQNSFSKLSWTQDKKTGLYHSRFDSSFPERRRISYYFKQNFQANEALGLYQKLEDTNFPTLYASTSFGDDWAESFVSYVHVELLKKPFKLLLKYKDKTLKEFNICYLNSRCLKKKEFLEVYLKER